MDIILYAIIAVILIYRLYTVLGRDEGPIPEHVTNVRVNLPPKSKPDKLDALLKRYNIPVFLKPAFSAIILKDPTFDFKEFLEGAEGAYEMILTKAFQHEEAELSNYVAASVLDSFKKFELHPRVRVKLIDTAIVNAEFHHPTAFITVQFKSRIQGRTSTWDRMEDWVFSRNLDGNSITWVLKEILPLNVH